MKRFLSVLLAAMMFLLPGFSLAEDQELAGGELIPAETSQANPALQALLGANFASKYLLQGQELTVDWGMKPGPAVLNMVPEELRTAVEELLAALKFRTTVQAADGMAQAGEALLLDGEPAVEFRTAVDRTGIYAGSSILGDTVVKVSGEQIKALLQQAAASAVNEGKLPQEAVDSFVSAIRQLKDDPAAFLQKAVGEPDLNGLFMQVFKMIGAMTMEEVTEAPAAMPDARYVTVLPILKEDLNALGAEIVNVLWSMPAVQKLASFIQVNGAPVTEERVMRKMATLGNHLEEDTCLRIYETGDGQKIYVELAAKLYARGRSADSAVGMLISIDPDTGVVTVDTEMKLESGETRIVSRAVADTAVQDGQQTMHLSMSADLTRGEETFQPVFGQFTFVNAADETFRSSTVEGVYRLQRDAGSAPVGIQMSAEDNSRDAGDHAEETYTGTMALEGGEEIYTLSGQAVTGLAEAYIITPDAVDVLGMEPAEQQAFVQDTMMSAMATLGGLISRLPASVQELVYGLMVQ